MALQIELERRSLLRGGIMHGNRYGSWSSEVYCTLLNI